MKDASNPSLDKLDLDASTLDKLVADKMELHCRQQLSAMLDGALSPDEARFLLRRLQHDHEMAACWERWQLCGDLMRGSAPAVLPSDFARRVSTALAAGSPGSGAQGTISAQGPRWMRWAGGAALAASVAATALFVAQRDPVIDGRNPAPVRQVSASSPAPTPLLQVATSEPEPAPAPAAPDQPERSGAAALAATAAVAAAELPRRTVRRNRTPVARKAPAETAPVRTQADASAMVAAADLPARGAVEDASALVADRDPFVGEAIIPAARPWPRAVLPGTINGVLNADYGMGGGTVSGSGFEYFEPQVPVEDPPPQP